MCRRRSRREGRALLAEFQKSNQAVIDALNAYEAFLKTDLLPRSKGDFRIGADTYRKKLLYDEMVDIPLDRLLEIGTGEPAPESGGVQAGGGADRQVADRRSRFWTKPEDHPSADKLLQRFRDVLSGLREFIEKNRSSPFRRRCRRLWRRRRPSCAP